jgi:uncharacterized membrane protein YraQ (UPF0718 family)
MNNKTVQEIAKIRSRFKPWIFPVVVVIVYLILSVISQDRTLISVQASGRVFLQVWLPLLLAFALMFLLNLFISPAHVSRYMGHGTGLKGILLSSIAGIISMGPIFAWYPLLKTLKEKGASDFHLANFLANRAVKPVLLPLMIAYFGWRFSLIFTATCMACALLTATVVSVFTRSR